MKKLNFMYDGSNDKWSQFPVSRDWADIDCMATSCRYNDNLKCGIPSRAKFNDKARCEGFEPFVMKTKVDGD